MSESLRIIRDSFHAQFLNIRNCNNLIQGDDFEIAYEAASVQERRLVMEAIERLDKTKIKDFIDDKLVKLTPFEKLGIRKLREIGQHMRITGYQSMSKPELIKEIKNVVSRLKGNGERISFQPEQPRQNTENSAGCGQPALLDDACYGANT